MLGTRFDLGIALDGDADRFLAVDHSGTVVDGDQIMATGGVGSERTRQIKDDTLVVCYE